MTTDNIYVVAATGGYEEPSYSLESDAMSAVTRFMQWESEADAEDGDLVYVLKINVGEGTIEKTYPEAETA